MALNLLREDVDELFNWRPYQTEGIDLTRGLASLENERASLAPDPMDALRGAQSQILAPSYGRDIHSFDPFDPNLYAPHGQSAPTDPYAELQERMLNSRDRLMQANEERHNAANAARQRLAGLRGQINRGLPWLAFAGEVMQPPSKSGHPFESIGKGISALTSGLGAVNEQELGIERALANAELAGSEKDFANQLGIENFDLNALNTQSRLRAIQERLKLAKAAKDKGPLEKQLIDWVDASESPEEKARREKVIGMVRGTSQMKNAGALLGGGDFGDTVASLVMLPQFKSYIAQAEKMFPADAYQGQPVDVRNKLVLQKALELARQGRSAAPGPRAELPAQEDDGGIDVEIPDEENVVEQAAQPPVRQPAPSVRQPAPAQRSGPPQLEVPPPPEAGVIPDKAAEAGRKKIAEENVELNKKRLEEQPKAIRGLRNSISKTANVLERVDHALKLADEFGTTGMTGELMQNIPSTDARSMRETLKTIKANLGFDTLQEMRASSPTGGALGQVAVQELDALQAAVASLDQGQDDDELIANLGKIKQHYNKWREVASQAYKEQYPEFANDLEPIKREQRFRILRRK